MPFPEIDPVLLQLGPIAIRWYALAYVAGAVVGWWYAVRLVRNASLWGGRPPTATRDQVDDLILWIVAGVIFGGRLGSVLFYSPQLIWTNPLKIFAIWEGGMSFHGGLIGVAIALVFFARANRIDLLRLADLVAPAVPFGLFFGRVANFVNGELWGRTTDLPWGVVFCNEHLRKANNCIAGELPRHPSQLYEAALEGIVLFLILRWATHGAKWLQRQGGVVGLFLLSYGLFRILLENVREPDGWMPAFPLGLTMGILLSVPMVLAGAWLVWRAVKQVPIPAEAAPLSAPAEPAPEPAGAAPPELAAKPAPKAKPAKRTPPKAKAAATTSKAAMKPKASPRPKPAAVQSPAKAKAPARRKAPARPKPPKTP